MNVCIVETHYHSEYLNTLIQLYPNSDVYTTKFVYDDLPDSAKSLAKNFFFIGSQNKSQFIDSIQTQDYDLLFVNTIQETMFDLRNWKNFKPKCKSVLTLHNLNAWFNKPVFSFRKPLHSFDSFLFSFNRSSVLKNFDVLSVCYEPLLQTLLTRTKRKSLFIPFALSEDSVLIDKPKEEIWFVIPGTVSTKRRDYTSVLLAFEKILPNHPEVRLILLGKNEDKIEIPSVQNAEEQIITYENSVPRDLYNSTLKNTDFVIIPSLQYSSTVNVIPEQYGTTKSPNIPDAIKWRKPVLLPFYIRTPVSLSTSIISYSPDNLDLYIENVIVNQTKLKTSAYKNTSCYTRTKIKRYLETELEKCKK